LLREVQRIKSQGDFEAAKALVEGYGVKVEPELHQQVLDRMAKLNLAPYSGFINPVIQAEEKAGKIVDVTVTYPDDITQQMLYYGANYSFLPVKN
jgi:dipeptidyl-peptidase III